jgi:FHS family L-fucose permease-like MFS transporter
MESNSLFRGKNGENYLFPFIMVTSLFLMWGFAHSLLDVLNKHFQDILHISKAVSGLVQFSLYGGYFVMGIPQDFSSSGSVIKKVLWQVCCCSVWAHFCFIQLP